MKRRFSDQELFELRNYVPIDGLIAQKLMIPSKKSEKIFRFLCPRCNEFQTSVYFKKNLARCFRCEINFNTIEIVMDWRKIGFVESVQYLKAYRQTLNHLSADKPVESKEKKTNSQFLSIGEIFKKIAERS